MSQDAIQAKILKVILSSNESASTSHENNNESSIEVEYPPTNETTIRSLSKLLTSLLCYNVSKETHQRYAVRTNIIDMVRKWSQPEEPLTHFPSLTDGELTLKILLRVMNKRLTNEGYSDEHMKPMVSLGRAIEPLLTKYPHCANELEKVVKNILSLSPNVESKQFLCYLAKKEDTCLKPETVEKIYYSERAELIEKPLLDAFSSFVAVQPNASPKYLTMFDSPLMKRLITFGSESHFVFCLFLDCLRSFATALDFAPVALRFANLALQRVNLQCNQDNRDFLSLYPKDLQCCFLLLQILPCYHDQRSKEHTIAKLWKIYARNKNEALILLIQFPDWFDDFFNYTGRPIEFR